jgi:hypothetical protein
MTRGPSPLAILVLAVCPLAASLPAQVNQGVIISEVVFGPALPPVGGQPMPSYIELVNVRIANPTANSVQIGNAGAQATIRANVGGNPPVTIQLPVTTLGGNVQPLPATQPVPPPAAAPVMLIASAPFPSGVVIPPNVPVHVDTTNTLFTGPNLFLGAPGFSFDVCFQNPATGLSDRVNLGNPTAFGCTAIPFNNTSTFAPTTGRAIRWCYMDSNTDIDFDSSFQHSPGVVNHEMAHVNGFFFGTTTSPALGGVPLNHPSGATSGSMFFPANARVKSVNFFKPPFINRSITNPAFDAILNAQVFLNASFTAQPAATAGPPNFLPGLQITNELMTIIANAGASVLQMPMNFSSLVGVNVGPSVTPGEVRPERIFSDLVTDAGAVVSGVPTQAQIDVTPGSAGDGNTWCEIIVYDYNGNQYRAKVKNWPQGPICGGGPLLALGADGAGSCTVIDLCFSANSMVANVFSTLPSLGCGSPLLPPGGICPDAVTSWILTPPQFGTAPFFTTTDANGIYLFHAPTGTLAALIGTTFYGIAVEYTATGAIVQQSPVNSVTI